jgi:hypothetical protein
MNLADTREAIADALSTVDGYNVRPRGIPPVPKTGDGWITVLSVQPSTESFTGYMVRMTAVVVLSSDEAKAEEILEEDAVELLTAIIEADEINPADISLEAQALFTGANQAPLYVAALALTLEVD